MKRCWDALDWAVLSAYVGAFVCCGLLGAIISFLLYFRRLPLEAIGTLGAIGGIVVAGGTLILAYFTRESVRGTAYLIASDDANKCVDRSIDLLNRYFLMPIQVTQTIALPPQAANSQIRLFGGTKLQEALALKAQYSESGTTGADEQYRTIVASFHILLNFYRVARQLLGQRVLNRRLFMNSFAKTFIKSFDAMLVLNASIEAVSSADIEDLRNLRIDCEKYLAAVAAASHAM